MKRKLLSLLVLLMTAATGAWAETVTWNSTNVFNDSHWMDDLSQWHSNPLTYEGIQISFSGTDVSSFTPYDPQEGKARLNCYGGDGDSFTFTAPSGKVFTKIEIIDNSSVVFTAYGDWTKPEIEKIVWRGTPASTVTLGGSNSTFASNLNSIVFTLATVVASGNCGTSGHESEVTWTLISDGVLTISGSGAMADYANASGQPWYSNSASITSVVVGSGVTHIGNDSFSELSNMTSVTLNEGLLTIGEYAFYNDNNAGFTSVTIPASVTSICDCAFNYCTNLATVTFSDGSNLTTIGYNAFKACSTLGSITIPASVTSIDGYVFYNCSNLATVTFNSNPAIGTYALMNIKAGATVTMNLTANGPVDGAYWTTFYNENYGFTADGNTTIYKATVNGAKTAVVLTEVADIPANNAAVLKSSNAAITMTLTTSASDDYTGNELQGANAAMAAPTNAYCLTGYDGTLGFYTYTGTIPVNKAYLVVPSSARSFYGFGDNYTTDIDLPEAVVIEDDGPIYDLSGRRVTGQPKKGIYVKNGKLFVIK